MTVYKGNTTVKACKLAGIKEIPVILTDFKDKASAVAYALADNKASEWSEWDDTMLQKLLNNKESIQEQAKSTGFTEKELKGLKALEVHDFDELPNVEIQGESEVSGNFIVIRFNSEKLYNKVCNSFGITKGKRVIEWENISEKVSL